MHDPIISITTIIAITIIIYFRKRERKGNWSLDAARMPGSELERTGGRAERSKRVSLLGKKNLRPRSFSDAG